VTPDRIRSILTKIERGELGVEEATKELRDLAFEDLGFAKIDHHRTLRRGYPEVVFGPGKTPEQIAEIAARMESGGHSVLVTRTTQAAFEAVRASSASARWHESASAITIPAPSQEPGQENGLAVVVSAGTSDISIAEEAALTAELVGASVERLFDVGVAGLHRLLSHGDLLGRADVIIVVAGMEGALPSVVSGLVAAPVIAVPTSVGYGASFDGLAALLAMLNSCSPGVSVVNIDNGFGAGYLAGTICRMLGERGK
jgi:NCAIR mutase (PurE)-related protein